MAFAIDYILIYYLNDVRFSLSAGLYNSTVCQVGRSD